MGGGGLLKFDISPLISFYCFTEGFLFCHCEIKRDFILNGFNFQVIAVSYAIMTTKSVDMNSKMRAIRVLPMFLLPALSFAAYSTFVSFIRMRKCQRIVFATLVSNLMAQFLDWKLVFRV